MKEVSILKKESYIENFSARHAGASAKQAKGGKKFIEINLKYPAVMSAIKRVSRPGQRIYVGASKIKSVKNGHGFSVISTPKGLMTNKEARKACLGGEILFEIW